MGFVFRTLITNTVVMIDDPRGSIWRRWDLHIHTPASGFGTEADYPTLIENLKSSEADVIGINDYATIDGYSKILEMGGVNGKSGSVLTWTRKNSSSGAMIGCQPLA